MSYLQDFSSCTTIFCNLFLAKAYDLQAPLNLMPSAGPINCSGKKKLQDNNGRLPPIHCPNRLDIVQTGNRLYSTNDARPRQRAGDVIQGEPKPLPGYGHAASPGPAALLAEVRRLKADLEALRIRKNRSKSPRPSWQEAGLLQESGYLPQTTVSHYIETWA